MSNKYTKLHITETSLDAIEVSPHQLLSVKELKELQDKGGGNLGSLLGSLRGSGEFVDKGIYITHEENLKKYDFYLVIDECGSLVLVPVKKKK